MTRTLKDLGEFGFIEKIRKQIRSGGAVKLGIGDDAAVIKGTKDDVLFTTDMLIGGKHFRLSEAAPYQIGRKALAVNISDIAAMGGVPTHAVISAGFPANTPLDFLNELYRGIMATARSFRVNIVGGDTNSSEKLVLSVAMLGTVKRNQAVRRSGAKAGDVIFVSGSLGGSYGSKKHLDFMPRVKESQYLVNNFKVHAMMDVSDGLSSDIRRLAKESRVGALLHEASIPVSKTAKNTLAALTDGEDFELLFTVPEKEAGRLLRTRRPPGLAPFTEIGKIVPKKNGIKIIDFSGRVKILEEKGFDHYAKRRPV